MSLLVHEAAPAAPANAMPPGPPPDLGVKARDPEEAVQAVENGRRSLRSAARDRAGTKHGRRSYEGSTDESGASETDEELDQGAAAGDGDDEDWGRKRKRGRTGRARPPVNQFAVMPAPGPAPLIPTLPLPRSVASPLHAPADSPPAESGSSGPHAEAGMRGLSIPIPEPPDQLPFGSQTPASAQHKPKLIAYQNLRSRLFQTLSVGTRVSIRSSEQPGLSDVTRQRPELAGKTGTLTTVPVYPSTWLHVRMDDTGEIIKLRSSNFELLDKADGAPARVQTERRSRSLFFNQIQKGTVVLIQHHPSLLIQAGMPLRAVVVDAPVYPKTWLTVKLENSSIQVKVRTSQITLPEDAAAAGDAGVGREAVSASDVAAAEAITQLNAQSRPTNPPVQRQHKPKASKDSAAAGAKAKQPNGAAPLKAPNSSIFASNAQTAQLQVIQQQQHLQHQLAMLNQPSYLAFDPANPAMAAMHTSMTIPLLSSPYQYGAPWPMVAQASRVSSALSPRPDMPFDRRNFGYPLAASSEPYTLFNKQQQDFCTGVICPKLAALPKAWVFHSPLDVAKQDSEPSLYKLAQLFHRQCHYNNIPVLSTIIATQRAGGYPSILEFTKALRLLFTTVYSFFKDDQEIFHVAQEMEAALDMMLAAPRTMP